MRGQVYAQGFFPLTWFGDRNVYDDERMVELQSHDAYRNIRVVWLAARICSANQWIRFDSDSKKFVTTDYVNQVLRA